MANSCTSGVPWTAKARFWISLFNLGATVRHAPYPELLENVRPGGMVNELAAATGKRIVFYCAFGERSAMAVQAAQDAGLSSACHIEGGLDAWRRANGPIAVVADGL